MVYMTFQDREVNQDVIDVCNVLQHIIYQALEDTWHARWSIQTCMVHGGAKGRFHSSPRRM